MTDRDDKLDSQTPDLMDAIKQAIAEADEYRATRPKRESSPQEREREVERLMDWLESDGLDWEAVERAHNVRA
jgi:hypothetical protein